MKKYPNDNNIETGHTVETGHALSLRFFIMKKLFIFLLLFNSSILFANEIPQDKSDIIDSPDLILDSLLTDLVKLLQTKPLDFERLGVFLQKEFADYMDFDYIARWTVGKYYRYLDERQKTELIDQLKKFILGAIADRFMGYQLEQLHFLPAERGNQGEVHVAVVVDELMTTSTPIVFRFYHANAHWKIFDIAVNNHSVLNYYQRYFNTTMQQIEAN